MACLEHLCRKCGWHHMDNEIYQRCLVCKSNEVSNWFDEKEMSEGEVWEDEDD